MGVSKSKDAKMIEQSINAQFQQPGQQQQQQQMFQPNGAQGFVQSPVQGFVQSPTQGFVQPPGAFPTQQQLNAQLGQQLQQMQQQQPQMQIQQQIPSIGQAPQAFPQQQTFPSFPAFPAMPQNVTMGNMQFPNLPSLPANAIFPSNTSAAFPVTFNQRKFSLFMAFFISFFFFNLISLFRNEAIDSRLCTGSRSKTAHATAANDCA